MLVTCPQCKRAVPGTPAACPFCKASLAAPADPGLARAKFDEALVHARAKRVAEALAAYEAALAADPRYLEAWNNKGNLLRQIDRLDEAVRCFDRAVALAPESPNAYFNKALAFEGLQRAAEAVEAYRAFLKRAPPEQAQQVQYALRRLAELAPERPEPVAPTATPAVRAGALTTMSDAGQMPATGRRPTSAPAAAEPLPVTPPREAVRQVLRPRTGQAPPPPRPPRQTAPPAYVRWAAAPLGVTADLVAKVFRAHMDAKRFLMWLFYAWWGAVGLAATSVGLENMQAAAGAAFVVFLGLFVWLRSRARAGAGGPLAAGEVIAYAYPGVWAIGGVLHAAAGLPGALIYLVVAASTAAVVWREIA